MTLDSFRGAASPASRPGVTLDSFGGAGAAPDWCGLVLPFEVPASCRIGVHDQAEPDGDAEPTGRDRGAGRSPVRRAAPWLCRASPAFSTGCKSARERQHWPNPLPLKPMLVARRAHADGDERAFYPPHRSANPANSQTAPPDRAHQTAPAGPLPPNRARPNRSHQPRPSNRARQTTPAKPRPPNRARQTVPGKPLPSGLASLDEPPTRTKRLRPMRPEELASTAIRPRSKRIYPLQRGARRPCHRSDRLWILPEAAAIVRRLVGR